MFETLAKVAEQQGISVVIILYLMYMHFRMSKRVEKLESSYTSKIEKQNETYLKIIERNTEAIEENSKTIKEAHESIGSVRVALEMFYDKGDRRDRYNDR